MTTNFYKISFRNTDFRPIGYVGPIAWLSVQIALKSEKVSMVTSILHVHGQECKILIALILLLLTYDCLKRSV